MRIGHLDLPNPFFMAPMAGVTDSIVRLLARRFACGMVYTEMVSSYALSVDGLKHTLGRMRFTEQEKPIGIQLFGSDGDVLAVAARKVQEAGADIVDINLGCSVPKIANAGAGAFLCKSPPQLEKILEKTVRAVDIPVTIKIRKGWDDHTVTALDVARRAESVGVAAIAIHGRTSRQMYSGRADWDFISELKRTVSIPIIGNGDINTPQQAVQRLQESGCDAVMIGRGSRGNPWIFREAYALWQQGEKAQPPSIQERKEVILEHLEHVIRDAGPDMGVGHMRKFLAWYSRGMPMSAQFRDRVHKVMTVEEMTRMLDEYFDSVEHWGTADYEACASQ